MRLICFWCFLLAALVNAQREEYYAPQTFKVTSNLNRNAACNCDAECGIQKPCKTEEDLLREFQAQQNYRQRELFSPAHNDVSSQSTTVTEPWRQPAPHNEGWRQQHAGPSIPKSEPWRQPYSLTKEQQAAILHHKQSLSSDGAFRYEYASDNGLAAGEQIEPDGSRTGSYQYKDPNGKMVKLKYRAGKDGFQILEGSHLPKSPEPVAPAQSDNYYQNAYHQQIEQYDLQQQYNQQKPAPAKAWGYNQDREESQKPAGNQYFINNWRSESSGVEDGQYRENDVDPNKPHNFGAGYAFAFKG